MSSDYFQGVKIKFSLLCSRMALYDNRRHLQTSLSVVLKISPLLLNITFANDSLMAAANILFPHLSHFTLLIFFFHSGSL